MDSPCVHEESDLLSVKETARRLGIARRTLEREVARKKFPPPIKIGSKSLYFVEDVRAYLENLKAGRERCMAIAREVRS